ADQALYAAKKDGKNRYAVYQSEPDAPSLAPEQIAALALHHPRQDAAAE
ncbi:MAG: GGDEF domain-containing protein, partial [Bradyrhizobium sp.]|nr:GGDEF domain-containing protein [Bradyrhizobium sp.]